MASTRISGDAIAFGIISPSSTEAARVTNTQPWAALGRKGTSAGKLWSEIGAKQKHANTQFCKRLSVVASRAGRLAQGGGYGGPSMQGTPSPGADLYLPFQKPTEDSSVAGSPEEHMEILRERRGQWYEFAPLLQGLYRQGLTSSMLDEYTGLTSIEQNTLIVGAQVHSTLKESDMSADTMAYFDMSDPLLLYELRVLSVTQRKVAAEYVRQQRMDGKAVKELSRAMKDHERMRGKPGRDAFSTAPGDCLAFAYYRNASECRRAEEKAIMAEKGIAVAVTESARTKLRTILDPSAPMPESDKGLMQVLRLTRDETNPRVIPVVGRLSEATPESLVSTPSPNFRGSFKVFASVGNCSWVALPSYSPITKADSPAVLTLDAASELPQKIASQGRTDEPVLLVVDRGNTGPVSAEHYYVVAKEEGGGIALQAGSVVTSSGAKALARVLLALRPPFGSQSEDLD